LQGAQSFLKLRETGAMQNQLELQAQYSLALGSFASLSAAAGYRRRPKQGAGAVLDRQTDSASGEV
jgi:hypothetical protein